MKNANSNRDSRSRAAGLVALSLSIGSMLHAAGCGGSEVGEATETVPQETEWREAETADGTWQVGWRPLVEPIPTLDPFAIEVRVLDSRGGLPPEGTAILVDATMPHHGHGMNVVPRILRNGDAWIAEGMLLHMPGRWEFVVDVLREHETERAQWTLLLDR
tara:strand:+ start:139 stop:621 length:483 start_codon:yes stop_codon:yes gene_type:complete